MTGVHTNVTHLVVSDVEENDFVLLLKDLHAELRCHDEWRGLGPALIDRIRNHRPAQGNLAAALEHRGRLRFEVRIGVIADQRLSIARPWPAQNGPNSRRRRLKKQPVAPPYDTGKIRDR